MRRVSRTFAGLERTDASERALRRVPYALVTFAGLLGVFLPGGTIVDTDLAWSVAILGVCLVIIALPWRSEHRGSADLAAAVTYVGFVVMLNEAQGGTALAGSFMLSLLPVMWIALYGDWIAGTVVVGASTAALVGLSVLANQGSSLILRKSLLWLLIATGITLAVHHLRDRFSDAIVERDETIKHSGAVVRALRELTILRDPEEVLRAGIRVAAELASGDAPGERRASYLVVEDGLVRVAHLHDESGLAQGASWPLAAHPPLMHVLKTLKPIAASLESLSTEARTTPAHSDFHYGAWVPVLHEGSVHGVIGIGGRRHPVESSSLALLESVAGVLELALDNAMTNDKLENLAMVDALTGCANRRGMSEAGPGKTNYVVIVADLDDFKNINDVYGHDAGDAALARFAGMLRAAVRAGDVVGRVGGDEFVILLNGTSPEAGRQVADRILAPSESWNAWPALRASLGVAIGSPDLPFESGVRRADMAMYEAKRSGGMRWVEWSDALLTTHGGVAQALTTEGR
jgi:diguanylate cyclase (GGDEF)-like protein